MRPLPSRLRVTHLQLPLFGLVALLLSPSTYAQQPPSAAPLPVVHVVPNPSRPAGDTLSAPTPLPLDLAMMPLRFGLIGATWMQSRAYPGCDAEVETGTNTQYGFPLQRSAAMRLTPRLTLVGFSRTGCQVDAAIGGGFVYTAPIAKNVWLLGSVGALAMPHGGPGGVANWKSEARVDLMFRSAPAQAWTVGVRATGGGISGVTFGGLL